jgi:CelD/BcsL family acetyltransferase involved in cellulose biosynthesis
MFALPNSFEAYINSLDKRQRQNYRRDGNLLAREHQSSCDVISSRDAALCSFEEFVVMHRQQWEAQGRSGHFADWPGSEQFNRELVSTMSQLDRFRMYRVLADGEPVSYQCCFVFGDRCYWRLPARASESRWDRFGLGRLGLMRMLESAIADGVRYIEAGAGHYDYKVQLGGKEYRIKTLTMVSHRVTAQLRFRAFRVLSDVLHLLYYRVWFLRVRPRLPFGRRPLWRSWVRSRL